MSMNISNRNSSEREEMNRFVKKLNNEDLVKQLEALLKDDCLLEVDILAYMGEVDHRRLYRERAFSSMFQFVVEELFLSESMAYKRITAARLARKYPVLLTKLAKGDLHLTGICLLAPHLTCENLEELAHAATHQSKRGIERLLALRFPKPDVTARVRKLPTRTPSATSTPLGTTQSQAEHSSTSCSEKVARDEPLSCAPVEPVSPPPMASVSAQCAVSAQCKAAVASQGASQRDQVAVLSEDRYKVSFTADAELRAKLQEAQELLGPRVRKDDLAAVFSRALDLLVSDLKNKKHGVTSRPRNAKTSPEPDPKPPSRVIPRRVQREVFERDQGQCTYQDARGHRCQERSGLEYHHRIPYGRGGQSTTDNLELRCRPHNGLAAEQDYGTDHCARFRRQTVYEPRAVYCVSAWSRDLLSPESVNELTQTTPNRAATS